MKIVNWVLVVVGLLGGLCVGNMRPIANAQSIPNAVAPRFQVSAYAYSAISPQTPKQACYIMDTVTGALWHASPDIQGRPLKVSDKLP